MPCHIPLSRLAIFRNASAYVFFGPCLSANCCFNDLHFPQFNSFSDMHAGRQLLLAAPILSKVVIRLKAEEFFNFMPSLYAECLACQSVCNLHVECSGQQSSLR